MALLIPALALCALMLWPIDAHADDDPPPHEITRYDVEAELDDSGQTKVHIEFDIDYHGEPAHGPFVTLPERQAVRENKDVWRNIPVHDIKTTSPSGAPADANIERTADGVGIKIGDPHTEVEGIQTYTLDYVVDGLPNPRIDENTDQLGWNVIGNQWEIPIRNISVTVTGPATISDARCFAGSLYSSASCDEASSSGRSATFTERAVHPGDGLTVVTDFPAGSLPETAVTYSRRVHLGNMFETTPVSLGGTGIAALVAVIGTTAARRANRDRAFQGLTPGLTPHHADAVPVGDRRKTPVAVRFTPPEERNPGLLGTLIDAKVDQRDISASIIDLAVRGHIQVEQTGPYEYRFHRRAPLNSDRLHPHERSLMEALFARGQVFDTAVVRNNETVAKRFTEHLRAAQGDLYRESQKLGWFRNNPYNHRVMWTVIAAFVTGIGVLTAYGLGQIGYGLIGLPIAIAGVVLLLSAQKFTARTPHGSAMLEQLLGFREYIATAEAHELRWQEGEDLFSKYLPYAIMFNLAHRWTQLFDELRAKGIYTAEPSWYYGPSMSHMYGFGGLSNISTGLSQTISSSVSAAASQASSSGGAGGVGGGVGGGGGGTW